MNIHPTAIVDPSAQLGQHVEIGPYAVIESDVTLGDNCRISAHVVIRRYVTMGPNCRVHPGAVIGDTPQDLAFKETDPSYVRIGAGCVFREFVTIHRGTKPETATEIGNGCYFMACSHAAHNVRVGDNVILANGALLGGYAEIGERAFLSGNVAVHQFCRVGRLAMMGGNSATSKDVPPFCLVPGLTDNGVGALNIVGLRRAGIGPEERRAIKRAFRLVYRSGLTFSDAVTAIRREFPAGPAREMADFIETSKRGICPLKFGPDDPGDEE